MSTSTRREILIRLSAGSAGLLLSRPSISAVRLAGIEELAERMRRTPRLQILDLAASVIREGADLETFLGAVFMAGIQEIRPRHVGGKLHAVMMVESTFQLVAKSSHHDAWLAALWNLDDFKHSQQRDVQAGDWRLPPRPDVAFASESAARKEFLAAMDAWDAERADRALVGLAPFHDHDSLYEILWPLAARCYVNIGHKIIYAVQISRVLRRLGWERAEPALRSLVDGLLFAPDGPRTEAYASSVEKLEEFPVYRLAGRRDPERSEALLRDLRTASPQEAQDLVIDAFRTGDVPDTVWDGLRLFASELFLKRPILLPVHAVTVTNAFGHAWRTSRDEQTRRMLILQSAAFLALLRDDLKEMVDLSMDGPGIDLLGEKNQEGETPGLDEIFEESSPDLLRLRLDEDPSSFALAEARLRQSLYRKGSEHHQHKYLAAVHEESRLVDPRWRSRILAPATAYLPGAEAAETEIARRSSAMLRKVLV